MAELTGLSATLATLSAMLTPVVLISACGSLTISTANRLARAIDRTRRLANDLEDLVQNHADWVLMEQRRDMLFEQLHHSTQRVRILHRALTSLYVALGVFVATSVAIGLSQTFNERYPWLPLVLSMVGAILLFYTCFLLILETQIARTAIFKEMDFDWLLAQQYVPKALVEQHTAHRGFLRRWNRVRKP